MEHACEVEVVDYTESIDEDLTAELAELCCFALDLEAAAGEWSVTLVFTSDEHLTRLHDDFMGIPEPTDIMTFPDDDAPGGDIVISVHQAERQRNDDGWPLAQELRFLVVHGVLHLTGWDDATTSQRAAMLDRQRAINDAYQNDPSRIR